jgi:hypothetical protein
MDHLALIPHFGNGRGRLARHGRAVVYSVADPVASAAVASWCTFVGDRPAGDALDDLGRILQRSAISALAAFVEDGDGLEVLTAGGAPISADGAPLAGTQLPHRQRVTAASIELLATGTLADDPLLDFVEGVVAADGFSLRRSAAAPAPWADAGGAMAQSAPAAAAQPAAEQPAPTEVPPPADTAAPAMAGMPGGAGVMAGAAAAAGVPSADELAAMGEPEVMIDPGVVETPAGVVSLLAGDDDLPAAEPLPIAGGPAPEPGPMAAPAPAADGTPGPAATEPVAVTPAPQPGHVMVAGLRCARGHFNDPRARFCATCGIAMHQASFVLTEDVRPPLGVITFADGTFYSVAGNLVFGRDPEDDPAIRAGAATPATLVDPQNTISRVHAEVRAIDWDVYLVDRGSTNGTFVWNAAAQQWDRLVPDQPRVIEPGAQISFGRLVAAFDSGLRP